MMRPKMDWLPGRNAWFKAWPLWLWWLWALAALLFVMLLAISHASPNSSKRLTAVLCSPSNVLTIELMQSTAGCGSSSGKTLPTSRGGTNGLLTPIAAWTDLNSYSTNPITVNSHNLMRF